jgi:hypothetical protein
MPAIPMLTLLVAIISGGIVGGVVTAIFNRVFHERALRTKFYPKVGNMAGVYMFRFMQPNGRYWVHIVGDKPLGADRDFVEQRSHFWTELVEFTELKEVQVVREVFLHNSLHNLSRGSTMKHDLYPEYRAMEDCMKAMHKKLPSLPWMVPSDWDKKSSKTPI